MSSRTKIKLRLSSSNAETNPRLWSISVVVRFFRFRFVGVSIVVDECSLSFGSSRVRLGDRLRFNDLDGDSIWFWWRWFVIAGKMATSEDEDTDEWIELLINESEVQTQATLGALQQIRERTNETEEKRAREAVVLPFRTCFELDWNTMDDKKRETHSPRDSKTRPTEWKFSFAKKLSRYRLSNEKASSRIKVAHRGRCLY